jgi:hypothetical protein
MTTLLVVLGFIAVLLGLVFLGIRAIASAARQTEIVFRPCYRCGEVSTRDFMGLNYCAMCHVVVVRMLPVVRHDPPYGFPGAPGYTEFPRQSIDTEAKKEG